MNGAFLYDAVRTGNWLDPIRFGREYYSRFPSISLPYHPPLFPALEAGFFTLFGVSVWSARLSVACGAALAASLLFLLVVRTHRSRVLGIAALAGLAGLNSTRILATEVMLEMWMLVFIAGALHMLLRGRWVWFAVLAGAAVWTKQQALFLAGVPLINGVLEEGWRGVKRRSSWLAGALTVMLAAPVFLLPRLIALGGGNPGWPRDPLPALVLHHLRFYANTLREETGWVAAAALGAALTAGIWLRKPEDRVYVGWALAGLGLLLVLPPYDERYLFLCYPPLIILALSAARRLPLPQPAGVAATAVLICAAGFGDTSKYLRGVSQAAALAGPGRVLYCGNANGSFIFSLRSREPGLETIVIRGDKLPEQIFRADEFEQFARRFGIRQIFLQKNHAAMPWDGLIHAPAPSMQLDRRIAVESSEPRYRGDIWVYRFKNPSPTPERKLVLRSELTGKPEQLLF